MADRRLLIVDDSKLYRNSMIFAFQKYFTVDSCGNLADALKLIQKHHYDLLIIDGAFPESGDYELPNPTDSDYRGNLLAEAARKRGIIVIGTSAAPEKLKNCDYTFKKPFDILEMINFIKKELKII